MGSAAAAAPHLTVPKTYRSVAPRMVQLLIVNAFIAVDAISSIAILSLFSRWHQLFSSRLGLDASAPLGVLRAWVRACVLPTTVRFTTR